MDYNNVKNFDELIDLEHGKPGTESRNKYEEHAQMFIEDEMLKAANPQENLMHKEFAEKNRDIKE
jgi:hypothetical protein